MTYHVAITSEHNQGYVGYDSSKDLIVVGFRGSDNFDNWISNINAFYVDYGRCDGCEVHDGF